MIKKKKSTLNRGPIQTSKFQKLKYVSQEILSAPWSPAPSPHCPAPSREELNQKFVSCKNTERWANQIAATLSKRASRTRAPIGWSPRPHRAHEMCCFFFGGRVNNLFLFILCVFAQRYCIDATRVCTAPFTLFFFFLSLLTGVGEGVEGRGGLRGRSLMGTSHAHWQTINNNNNNEKSNKKKYIMCLVRNRPATSSAPDVHPHSATPLHSNFFFSFFNLFFTSSTQSDTQLSLVRPATPTTVCSRRAL